MKLQTHSKGFTLIELVVIIVLIGVLSAVILPRLSLRSTFDERVIKDEIINVARYAQQLAMMRGKGYTVRFHISDNAKNYGIDSRQGTGAYSWIYHANGEIFPLALPDNISILPTNIVITYDALGNSVAGVSQAITVVGLANSTLCIDASGFAHNGVC